MKTRTRRRSLFSQRLDRAAFAAYFLGAVVPLCALAWEIHRNELQGEGAIGWLALLISIAVLSLGAYLALRRATKESLARMARDQARLSGLLAASAELSRLPDRQSAAESLLRHAGRLAKASGAFLAERAEQGVWTVTHSAGIAEAEAMLDEPLCETFERVCSSEGASEETAGGGIQVVAVRAEGSAPTVLVTIPAPGQAFTEATDDALGTLGTLSAVALANADLRHAQRNFFAHVTELLTTALDVHLGYHGGHGHRSAELCNRVGRAMGLGPERLQALHFAALLHDIGMLKMDRDLALAPCAWQPHTRHGYEMLKEIRLWESSAPIVLSHHERWDGRGYPESLRGDEIPLEARILAVCDSLDSMTAKSSYREPVGFQEALDELESCAGTQFDPEVVATVRRLAEEGIIEPAGTAVEDDQFVLV